MRSQHTTYNYPCCPLVPGGLGQWVVMACQLHSTSPYLLLYGLVAVREGLCPSFLRSVLTVLGWHVPFRWHDKSTVGNAIALPVSSSRQWMAVTLYKYHNTDLLFPILD